MFLYLCTLLFLCVYACWNINNLFFAWLVCYHYGRNDTWPKGLYLIGVCVEGFQAGLSCTLSVVWVMKRTALCECAHLLSLPLGIAECRSVLDLSHTYVFLLVIPAALFCSQQHKHTLITHWEWPGVSHVSGEVSPLTPRSSCAPGPPEETRPRLLSSRRRPAYGTRPTPPSSPPPRCWPESAWCKTRSGVWTGQLPKQHTFTSMSAQNHIDRHHQLWVLLKYGHFYEVKSNFNNNILVSQ